MSKSILVIYTPNYYIDCPCHFAGMSGQIWCGKENKELLADDIQTFKPDWCPLVELPQKMAEESRWFSEDYVKGRNACIDEILKGGGEWE